MLKKLLAGALSLSLLLSPALAEEGEIAALEERIAALEAENAELRQLLSQEESARLLAARFEGGVITVSEAKAEYDYMAYYYEQLGMDPDDHEDTIKTRCSATSPRTPSSPSRRRKWASTPPAPRRRRRYAPAPRPAWTRWWTTTWPTSPTPTGAMRRTAPPCWNSSPAKAPRWRA